MKKALLALLCCASPAVADEMWSTAEGRAVYESEINGAAVFVMPFGMLDARVYIEGLAGNFDKRSIHTGYWIMPDEGSCHSSISGPDGYASTHWGRVTIEFDGPSFPTGFTAYFGDCFEEPYNPVRADLY